MKTCTVCDQTLPEDQFPFKDKKTGRRSKLCKNCYNARQRQAYRENPDIHKVYQDRAYKKARANPRAVERQRAANRKYYENNKQVVSERIARYRKENRELVNRRQADWIKRNPEKRKAHVAKYYRSQKFREWTKEYRKKNLEKVQRTQRDSKRRYRANHPQEARKYDREYRKRPKAKLTDQINAHTKRARKRDAPGSFSGGDIKNKFRSQNGLCYWCKKSIKSDYHIDHYVPLSKGGTNFITNIVLACPTCNIRRHNKMPAESRRYLAKALPIKG